MKKILLLMILFIASLARADFFCPASNTWLPDGSVCGGASPFSTLTDAAPISWDVKKAAVGSVKVTLNHATATRALNVANLVNGGYYTLVIIQDSTGGAAMTLGTGCTWKVGGGGSGAIALSSGASAIDVLTFVYDGSNCLANFHNNFN